jgi:hypothetical protein
MMTTNILPHLLPGKTTPPIPPPEAVYAPQTLYRAPLTHGLGSGHDLTKLTTGKVYYNFCLINFA